jgi:type IV fimbrial biogenesis protein FimT
MRGFTLIELMVVVAIVAILAALGMPSFSAWVANAKVRTVAESLQSDFRLAQAEAVRRNRQVAFVLTNSSDPSASSVAAASPATNWSIRALPLLNSDEGGSNTAGKTTFIKGYAKTVNSDATVTGSVSLLCFNSVGRLVASSATITDAGGGSCAAPTTNTPLYFRVQNPAGDRPLWVSVELGGKIRMCDPNKTLGTHPDACCTAACCGISGLSAASFCK